MLVYHEHFLFISLAFLRILCIVAMIWDHAASWLIQISMNHGGPGHHMHELHVLLLSVAVVHLLSDPIIRLHMSPAPRAALGRCFSPRGVSTLCSRLRSMVPSLCETASTCEQMLWCRKPLRCLQDQAGGGQGAHLLARRRRGGGAGFMGAHSSASPVHLPYPQSQRWPQAGPRCCCSSAWPGCASGRRQGNRSR